MRKLKATTRRFMWHVIPRVAVPNRIISRVIYRINLKSKLEDLGISNFNETAIYVAI